MIKVVRKPKERRVGLLVVWEEIKRNRAAYLFILPFMVCFAVFIALPVVSATFLSFTSFDGISAVQFVGLRNFVDILSADLLLMTHVVPNTFIFAVAVGPVGYTLQFLLAWLINSIPRKIKILYTMAIYLPSIAGGVLISVVFTVFFSGDRLGHLNRFLINMGFIVDPIAWTQDSNTLLLVMIIVTIWGSMGVGFLSLFAGMQNVDEQLYEAGKIDGIRNAFQELIHITIPQMKPQMLFSAVMSIVGAIRAGSIGVQLSGQNPTPEYAGQLFQNHIEDFGFQRFELGYATALSFVLLAVTYALTKLCFKFLGERD
ncbi:MAG: sugar ABC transporter permease [Firmicutes bacterium]|nr:sugar ABC transporter permease [Bacillota bacterium]